LAEVHRGGGVDVGHHRQAGVALLDQAHVFGGDRRRQRAAGLQVGDQHGLVGGEGLGRLGHEVHAGLHDDLGVRARGFPRQSQAVADEVAHPVENLRRHVVVRQDHRVFFALQGVDRRDQGGVDAPLQGRDLRLDLLP
jgi:hypothetical protein